MFREKLVPAFQALRNFNFVRACWAIHRIGLGFAAFFFALSFMGVELGTGPRVSMALCIGTLFGAHVGPIVALFFYSEYTFSRATDRDMDFFTQFRYRVVPCFNWAFGGLISIGVIVVGLTVAEWFSGLLVEHYGKPPPISEQLCTDGVVVILVAVLTFFLRRDARRTA